MKITGYHVGPGGSATGIGTYVRALDEAGKAAFVMSADVTTGLSDIFSVWDEGSNTPHIAIYRVVKDGSQFWAVPHYDLPPEDAAADYFNRVEGEIAQEVKDRRDRVFIAIGNELDKNRADWIGEWLYHSALLWNENGYKVCGPGWASGEPEPHHWEGGMLQYLEYCGNNPGLAAIAVHEYSYNVGDIEDGADWLIGRYRFIYDTCDAHGIPRPQVFITEWGWELDNAPDSPERIVADIQTIHDRYDDYPPHALWFLGGGYGDIANEIQPSIEPVTNYLLSLPDPEPPMPNENEVLSITVSHHQGEMDWQVAKDAGVDVALIRLSIGNIKDSRADENFAGAAAMGIPRQPFHYLRLSDDAPNWVNQAIYFYSQMRKLDPPPELPPVFDIEDKKAAGRIFGKIRLFTVLLHGLCQESSDLPDLPPEAYTAAWWFNPNVGERSWWQNLYPLHVADYDDPLILPRGWDDWLWHQYSCSARGADYGASSTNICLSRFHGTRKDFELYYGLRQPEPESERRKGRLTRNWNIRWRPEFTDDARIGTGNAGQEVSVIGEVEGAEYDESTRWYELAVVTHSAGVEIEGGAPPPPSEPPPPPDPRASRITFPVGSAEERAVATNGWPGKWIDANPFGNYYHVRDGRYAYHTGADLNLNRPAWDSDRGKPVYSVAKGVVTYAGRFNNAWGNIIVIRHDSFYSRYSAIDNLKAAAGDEVAAGQQIGVVGQHKVGEPFHLHFDISTTERLAENPGDWPGTDRARLERDYTPPLQFILAQREDKLLDTRRFKVADPHCWRVVRSPSGSQEDVQDMDLGGGLFVRRKNSLAEWHRYDDEYFYLVHDTSPDVGSEGIPRVYTLYKSGSPGAPVAPVMRRVGEPWREDGTHTVQFRAKDNCRELNENSGVAQNANILRHEHNYTFNSYGQNLTFDEVIFEEGAHETQIYGIMDGKPCGWIGWIADWGSAEPVEIHWDRGVMTSEPDRICDW